MFFKEKKQWKALEEAVRNNDAAQVSSVAAGLRLSNDPKYYAACKLAVSSNGTAALEALLKAGKGFHFDSSSYENRRLGGELFELALADKGFFPLLPILYRGNKEAAFSHNQVSDQSILSENTPIELLRLILEDNPAGAFESCLKAVGPHSTENLKYILAFASQGYPALNKGRMEDVLLEVAEKGDKDKIELLVERGADPNCKSARALVLAAHAGHMDAIDYLVQRVDLEKYGGDVVTQLQAARAPEDVVERIEIALRCAVDDVNTEGFTLIDNDTLSGTQSMPDGATLTTVFNFRTRQEQFLLDRSKTGAPSVYSVSFNDIDKKTLDTMQKTLNALKTQALKA